AAPPGGDAGKPTGVAPRARAAAGAERVDVDRRQRDLRDADGLLTGQLRLAALEEGDVRGRPAHVEGDEIRLFDESGAVAARGDAAGRAGQHRAGGHAGRLAHRGHAAVRLNDQDVAAGAVALETRGEIFQVARQRRPDVRVHDGRPDPLVLLDLRQDLAGERYVRPWKASRHGASGQLFVPGIPVRV